MPVFMVESASLGLSPSRVRRPMGALDSGHQKRD